MFNYLFILFATMICIFFGKMAIASPWFTGPIFAGGGHTIARGHTNFELYSVEVSNRGKYDDSGKIIRKPLFQSLGFNPILTHGFTDWMDVQVTVPYIINSTRGMTYHRLADVSAGAGIQIFEQKKHPNWPDLRFFIQETFPTGSFEQLKPWFYGTDATGSGGYRTLMSMNFQYLAHLPWQQYLRTRLIFTRMYASSFHVSGLNSFGCTEQTEGTVRPGVEDDIDLAFELTLTQNWVAVMEGYITRGQSIQFNGIFDLATGGTPFPLRNQLLETGLAPALEYNFSSNLGIIGGIWFPVTGRNTSQFVSWVLALNAYW